MMLSKRLLTAAVATCFFAGFWSETRAEDPLYQMQDAFESETHWKSLRLNPGAKTEVARLDGSGVIKRFWCTFIPQDGKRNDYLGRALVLNLYWDGSDKPAVSVPLADFFCQPLHLQAVENRFFTASNAHCVFNSLIPMPFREGARVEIGNDSRDALLFWYGLDVERRPPGKDALYLHAYWNRQAHIGAEDEMIVLPRVTGKGRYLGTHWALRQKDVGQKWRWYTRNVRIYQDAEHLADKPTIRIGTLDDFVCSGWWSREIQPQPYAFPFTGRPLVRKEDGGDLSVAFYRYHVQDSIWFHKSLSVKVGEHVQFGRKELPTIAEGDWSTTAFFFFDKPVSSLPPIQKAEVRTSEF